MGDLDAAVAYAKSTGKATRPGSASPASAGADASSGCTPRTTRTSRRRSPGTARVLVRAQGDKTPMDVAARSRRRCSACTAAKIRAFRPIRRRRSGCAEKGGQDGRDRDLPGRAARLPRRLPAELPQSRVGRRMETDARLVQAIRRRLTPLLEARRSRARHAAHQVELVVRPHRRSRSPSGSTARRTRRSRRCPRCPRR